MLCVKCGYDNPDVVNCCSRCGAVMPRLLQTIKVDKADGETPVINERLARFEDAAAKVLSGEWDLEQYAAFLNELAEAMSIAENDLRLLPIPEDQPEQFNEELEAAARGLDLFNQGFEYLFAFVQEPNPDFLEQGMVYMREGNAAINEALAINRRLREVLEEQCTESMGVF